MTQLPRVVIAAAGSASGKTTVATGLMAALTARGHAVSGHKVGPDYIDPGYHALATDRPPRNLDPMLCGVDRVPALLRHGARGADLAIIEGVMGLFDGASAPQATVAGPGDFASTAHVAHLVSAPVILVVDAARMSRSVAALVHGFCVFDPRVRVAGVILNRVGSERHERLLREALEDVGTPVLGAIRRDERLETPSRHLGLVPAAERGAQARALVRLLGQAVGEACDLEAILAVARSAPPVAHEPWDPEAELAKAGLEGPKDCRVAVAGGAAFTFGYTEQAELLRAGGARLAHVDPLTAAALPDDPHALVVGGGFPEVHAPELSDNIALRGDVALHARRGRPIAAECAGLLYLCRSLDGAPMCGVVAADAAMTGRLRLGYRQAVAVGASPLGPAGTRVVGHEFHRTAVTPAHGARPAWRWPEPEGFADDTLHASYLHVHWAGAPELAVGLLDAAARAATTVR